MYGRSYRDMPGGRVPFRWMPPESLLRRRFSEASDVWSFGVTAWELLSGGNLPYAFIGREDEVAERVCAGQRLAQPDGCTDELWGIVNSCWAAEPGQRPRFAQLGVLLASQLRPVAAVVEASVQVGEGTCREGIVGQHGGYGPMRWLR